MLELCTMIGLRASRACQPHHPTSDARQSVLLPGWPLIFADPESYSHAQKSRPLLRLAAQKILSDMTRFVRAANGRIAESVSLLWRKKRKESCDLFSRCFEYVAYLKKIEYRDSSGLRTRM